MRRVLPATGAPARPSNRARSSRQNTGGPTDYRHVRCTKYRRGLSFGIVTSAAPDRQPHSRVSVRSSTLFCGADDQPVRNRTIDSGPHVACRLERRNADSSPGPRKAAPGLVRDPLVSSSVAANEAVADEKGARTPTSASRPDTRIRSGTERSTGSTLRGRIADLPLAAVISLIWVLHRLWLVLPPRASTATSSSRSDRRRDDRHPVSAPSSRTTGRRTAAVKAETVSLGESQES